MSKKKKISNCIRISKATETEKIVLIIPTTQTTFPATKYDSHNV